DGEGHVPQPAGVDFRHGGRPDFRRRSGRSGGRDSRPGTGAPAPGGGEPPRRNRRAVSADTRPLGRFDLLRDGDRTIVPMVARGLPLAPGPEAAGPAPSGGAPRRTRGRADPLAGPDGRSARGAPRIPAAGWNVE